MKENLKISQNNVKTGTWNVRTLLKVEKLEEVKREMRKSKIDILGVVRQEEMEISIAMSSE